MLAATHRPSPSVMADGRRHGVPREMSSVALDRLFLEFHDQLPKLSRERFAQLADETKKLTEPSTAEDPVTPTSSADQAVVRRKEEIATAEAKQSSGELQERGKAYCMHVICRHYLNLKVAIAQDYLYSYIARILLSTVVFYRCSCYVTQRPAHPERCSMHCSAPCSTQVVHLGLALDIKTFVLDGVAHQQEKAEVQATSPPTGSSYSR